MSDVLSEANKQQVNGKADATGPQPNDFAAAEQPQKNILQRITPYGVMCNMDRLTDVLTALSHPTRRAIIGQLSKKGPARFLDVAEPFDTALNAVTKHLKLLERAELIEKKKMGREVMISFRAEPLKLVSGWVHEYERFWNERLDTFERYFMDKKNSEKKYEEIHEDRISRTRKRRR